MHILGGRGQTSDGIPRDAIRRRSRHVPAHAREEQVASLRVQRDRLKVTERAGALSRGDLERREIDEPRLNRRRYEDRDAALPPAVYGIVVVDGIAKFR